MQNLFSYPLKLEDMSSSTQKFELNADEKELKYIAEVMKVPAIKKFSAELNVKLYKKEHFVLKKEKTNELKSKKSNYVYRL